MKLNVVGVLDGSEEKYLGLNLKRSTDGLHVTLQDYLTKFLLDKKMLGVNHVKTPILDTSEIYLEYGNSLLSDIETLLYTISMQINPSPTIFSVTNFR